MVGKKHMAKKIVKSTNNRVICGVCAGIADQFNIDPTIIRVIWAIAIFAYGTGLLAYIICAIIFPNGTTDNLLAMHNKKLEDLLRPIGLLLPVEHTSYSSNDDDITHNLENIKCLTP